jgi:hypothetical protein
MKAALQGVAKHDFVFPGDEVKKVASCGRSYGPYEYYLSGTEPVTPCGNAHPLKQAEYGGIGKSNESTDLPPAPTFSPEPTAPPVDPTQPPNSVGDGTNYVPLESPAPESPAPAESPHPLRQTQDRLHG